MPGAASHTPSRTLLPLLLAFGSLAAILWLLPLLTPHSILFPSGPNFEDIIVYKGRFTLYHSARFFTSRAYSAFAYPAGAAPLYALFYATADATTTYLLLALAATITASTAALLYLRRHALTWFFLPLLLFSFPLVFLIQRANIELILWGVVAVGIVAYLRKLSYVAAILFGVAAAIKLYPIILLGLFLSPARTRSRHDLPAFVAGILTAIITTATAIAYSGPTFHIAAFGFFSGVDRFQGHYVDTVSRVEIAFDHCLFSPFKLFAYSQHISPAPWRSAYYACAGTLALLLFLRVRTLPSLNRIVFLVTAMVCLPPVSFNYTLVHLYVPLLLLLGALSQRSSPTALAALALLLFVMLPLVSLTLIAPLPTGTIQAVALLGLLIVCAHKPWAIEESAAHL